LIALNVIKQHYLNSILSVPIPNERAKFVIVIHFEHMGNKTPIYIYLEFNSLDAMSL